MSTQTTATVETLTAEVRVLMVGNRQVTLSVARQLDGCQLAAMEPFGRIHLGGDERDLVIGRHRVTGALVIAEYRRHPPLFVFIDEDDLTGKIIVCRGHRPDGGSHDLWADGRRIRVAVSVVQECGQESHCVYQKERCDHWQTNGCEAEIREAIERADRAFEAHRRAAALPLIVLAGLR